MQNGRLVIAVSSGSVENLTSLYVSALMTLGGIIASMLFQYMLKETITKGHAESSKLLRNPRYTKLDPLLRNNTRAQDAFMRLFEWEGQLMPALLTATALFIACIGVFGAVKNIEPTYGLLIYGGVICALMLPLSFFALYLEKGKGLRRISQLMYVSIANLAIFLCLGIAIIVFDKETMIVIIPSIYLLLLLFLMIGPSIKHVRRYNRNREGI